MDLTGAETYAKTYMESRFIPALHQLLEKSNPEAYRKWGGNACRQTAVFGVYLLAQLLPDYRWSVWEGVFSDVVRGKQVTYDHAWIFGKDPTGRRLLVDLSRNHHERLFLPVTSNKYPKNHPSYMYMKELSRVKLDHVDLLRDKEYYTQLPSTEVLCTLTDIIQGANDNV